MSIKFISTLVFAVSSAFAVPAIWNGTADVSWYKPDAQKFTLVTAEELAGVAKLVNEGISDFSNQTIALGADIFLNDTAGAGAGTWASIQRTAWTPIGTSAKPFKGEFDGIAGKKNRKIYGLYINDTTQSFAGLFGYTSNVKISNLDILVGRVTGANNVGALAGYALTGSVTNVHSEVKVTGKNHIGGLIGYYTGDISKSSVHEKVVGQDSVGGLVGYTSGSITGTASANSFFVGDVKGRNYVGGLAGYTTSFVENSYSEGSVTGSSSYVGGLVGYGASIDASSHTGGEVNGWKYVGGLAGYTTSFVKNSYSEGSVTGSSSYVGGLVGYGASIDSSSHTGGEVNGQDYVGGLIGWTSSIVKKSYSEGSVTGTGIYVGGLIGKGSSIDSSSHTGGEVNGLNYVGGLVGQASSTVKNSYSEGNVTGKHYVGGAVGSGSDIIDVYADGSVKGDSNYVGGLAGSAVAIDSSYHIGGDVFGSGYVGGLVGSASGAITRSYSKGLVTASGSNVGGLVGKTTQAVTSSYSEGNVTGKGNVGGAVGFGSNISKTYAEGIVKGDSSCVGGLAGSANAVDSTYHIGGEVKGTNYVGGLVGYGASVYSSNHTGGEVNGWNYVGGLAGYTTSFVKNSYSEGSVTGSSSYVGGLVGYAASVDSSNHTGGEVNGQGYVGGLAGHVFSTVKNSYSEGSVTGSGSYVGGLIGTGSSIDSSNHTGGEVNGQSYVGGLVGLATSSVKNSYSEGNVIGLGNNIGGLIGQSYYYYNGSGSTNVTIETARNSYAIGDVTGNKNVGGLVGSDSIYKKSMNSITLTKRIVDSYSKGYITGSENCVGGVLGMSNYDSYYSGSKCIFQIDSSYHENGNVISSSNYVGGVVGYAIGSIESSYHVNGDIIGFDSIGGLSGYVASTVRNSYAEAKNVKGNNLVGGLVGYAEKSINASYFEGDSVSGNFEIGGLVGYAKSSVDSSYSTANVKGDDNVGGLIGSAYGGISNSYALGNVDGFGEGAGAGHDNLGGLVGYQYSGSVTKSMALGNVSGTTNLGGLVGRFDGTSISQSYANGNVTGSYYGDPADEVGNYYIGGLVGYAKGSLNETYSSGIVKGMDKDPVYTGCMVGYVNGSLSVTKSYFDKSKCNLGIDGGENAVTLTGTPDKTTSEMQTQSSFEDWDFVDTWKILEKSYPFLQIYANSLTNATVETASLEGYKYDGTAKTPLVTSVKLFGETLEYGSEYTIAYSNNVNAGTASINVCGVKPYGGCKVINFEIAGITVKPTIAAIENETYTGRALTPEIKVYSGETLLAATDYTVEYKDNINAGTATVVVTMKGNYSGSASKTFKIEKATPIISQNPKAGDIVLGETLASSELTGGYANVEGKFVWKNSSTKPALENEGYAVVFVPTDAGNYTNSAEIIVPVKVLDMVYVAIHANGSTIDSVTILKGAEYSLPTVAEKIGFDFIGFYKGSAEVGKTGDKITITENTVIDAVYQIKKFGVTFLNGSVELQTSDVAYGEMPKYTGDTPIKTATAQYTYLFKGWTPELVKVTEKANYIAVFDSVVNKYVVTFVNGGETLQTDSLLYGEVPKYKGNSSPAKASTEQYDYTFKGWSPTITSVAGATTYTAVFDSTLRKYAITFKNGTTTLQTSSVAYGTKPSYTGTAPTKTSTDEYTYTFKGWNPTITSVIGAATYTAVFDSTLREYAITFKNGTTTLQTGNVAYGTKPSYTGNAPTKASTDKYTYTFKGWSPTIASVTGAATYTAIFDSTLRKYTITFKNGTTTLQTSDVAYGTKPSYTGSTPTKKATNKYTYKFKGWNPSIVAVTKAATYQAVFDSTKVTGIVEGRLASLGLSVRAVSRSIQISAAPKNSTYAILDMQGRVLLKGRVESANFNIAVPQAGSYLVRVGNATRKVQVK